MRKWALSHVCLVQVITGRSAYVGLVMVRVRVLQMLRGQGKGGTSPLSLVCVRSAPLAPAIPEHGQRHKSSSKTHRCTGLITSICAVSVWLHQLNVDRVM